MSVLKGILKDSAEYYKRVEKEINAKLSSLPRGSVKSRKISGKTYYYLQFRKGKKVVQKYLGKAAPLELSKQLKERRNLEEQLKKVKDSAKMLKKINK
ncbi:MAG: hypothetical protein ABIJ26_06665 [Candidatus Margulisiibacteriota bacterium]|nr:hypothetical protein [Candidatus Margulisiibacteriota bacterium]